MRDTLEKLGFDSAVVKVPGEELLRMPFAGCFILEAESFCCTI